MRRPDWGAANNPECNKPNSPNSVRPVVFWALSVTIPLPSYLMQALPPPKPPLPVRALTPADGPVPTAVEHIPASADRSPPQPLPIASAHEPQSRPRSPRPAVPQDESPVVQNGLGGANGAGGVGNSTQPPPSRLRSHDSLTGASARPRSRAGSDKPEPVQPEGGGNVDSTTIANAAAIAANSNNGNNRPLNVTDALSYLDAVKVQFYDKPDVYNHFLDIMKDFKSQMCVLPPLTGFFFLCGTFIRVSLPSQDPTRVRSFESFDRGALPASGCTMLCFNNEATASNHASCSRLEAARQLHLRSCLFWRSQCRSELLTHRCIFLFLVPRPEKGTDMPYTESILPE